MLDTVISNLLEKDVSDIHIQEGTGIHVRRNGILKDANRKIERSEIEQFLEKYASTPDGMLKRDFACTIAERRFRGNIYKSLGKYNIALRVLADTIPDMKSLHLPKEMYDLDKIGTGLFLVVGETGSGKSTTLASILNNIVNTQPVNVLTIEDPVEYIYSKGVARVAQREVGADVESFGQATTDAMREDPDIILLGEMRDMDTIANALTLAETGHKVFATLHSRSVVEVMDRVCDVFPSGSRSQIRSQLANVIQAVVHQVLVPSNKYGRLPLVEVMRVDATMRNALSREDCKAETVRAYLRSKRSLGNLHRSDCMKDLVEIWGVDPTLAQVYLSSEDYDLMIGR